jgi:hypothetical protein
LPSQPPQENIVTDQPHYTEGILNDGAAILRDGVMMPVEEVVSELNRLAALAQPQPEQAGEVTNSLPANYIDPGHSDVNRELLEAFYVAARSEGGTADEIYLRGIRAAIALDRSRRPVQAASIPLQPACTKDRGAWINHRLPTEDDADREDTVRLASYGKWNWGEGWELKHWKKIRPGEYWQQTGPEWFDAPFSSDTHRPLQTAEGDGPSDEDNWQWYTNCPEEGIELYDNKEQAKSAAESIMGSYQVSVHTDGWHEDMELLSWGKLVPFEQAQVVERRQAEPGGEWDEWVRHELRATRRARPVAEDSSVAQPAEGEVATIAARLKELSRAVTEQRWQEFSMRVPAEPLRDADLVIDRAAALLERHQPPQPVAVGERLPEPNRKVLAHYFNELGKGRTICAIWVPAKSRSDDFDSSDDDFQEYDEESDKYYWLEGWYEAIENWDDYGWIRVSEGEPVYWQPLPTWPTPTTPPEAAS